ncbi:MAG: pyrroline-5-carboxylate reductase [Bauldia sp.]
MSLATITADRPLVLVGAGKMGGAMLAGWLAQGLRADAVHVVDPAPPPDSAALLQRHGIAAAAEPEAGLTAGVLVVAVKPQMMGEVLPKLRAIVRPDTLVLSIAAGTTIAVLEHDLGAARVVRSMPNTPAQIGKGMTVAVATPAVGDARSFATDLLAAVGQVEWLDDEGLINAVTAVSGSGPAYVFFLAEALAEAGVEAGLDPVLSRKLADATIAGAGALLEQSGEAPAVLRQNVTSKGGTTAAALAVLMAEDGLAPILRRAVLAAKKRAEELAG